MLRQSHRSHGLLWRSLGSALLAAGLCATTWAQDNPQAAAAPHATVWGQTLAELQALKDLLERQNRETQNRLNQLEKNIQSLQTMQGAAQAATGVSTQAVGAASEAAPSSALPSEPASEPAPTASTPTPSTVAAAAPSQPVASDNAFDLASLPQPLWWAGALLLCMLLVVAVVRWRASRVSQSVQPISIPPQMASINLDLNAPASTFKDQRP